MKHLIVVSLIILRQSVYLARLHIQNENGREVLIISESSLRSQFFQRRVSIAARFFAILMFFVYVLENPRGL
jgi:hypothetical protein